MTLIIALNAALSLGVVLMVVAPLVWAIVTQNREVPAAAPRRRRSEQIHTARPALA